MPDHHALLVKLVPDNLGAPPAEPLVPSGPSIQETGSGKGESSTYETRDALKDKHDEDLFDWYAASQVALVDASTLAVTRVGKAGNVAGVDPSPDGQHLLVATIHKPYSYVTTADRFPREVEVWDIVETRGRDVEDDRLGPAGRPRAGRRRAARPARVQLALRRPGHADLGRGPRRRRLEGEGAAARQGDAAEGAVRDAGRGDRAHRAALHRLRVDRAPRHRADGGIRREPPLGAHVADRRRPSAGRHARAVGPVLRREVRQPGQPGLSPAGRRPVPDPDAGRLDLPGRHRRIARRRPPVPRPPRPEDAASPTACSAATATRWSASWPSPARTTTSS